MKLSILLPILAYGANKQPKKKEDNKSVDRFVAGNVREQCLDQIPKLGGNFQTTNDGSSGEIRLENYPRRVNCKHVVQAAPSCGEIKIKYRSIAVEGEDDCSNDNFRFGWETATGFEVTEPKCSCFGDGCDSGLITEYMYYGNTIREEVEFYGYYEENIGPDSLTVNANAFTFFFHADRYYFAGHVILDWECVRHTTTTTADYTTTTTTTPTTTSTTTTTTTTTTTPTPTTT